MTMYSEKSLPLIINKPIFGNYSPDNPGIFNKGYAAIFTRASKVLDHMEKNPLASLNSLVDLTITSNHEIARLVKIALDRINEISYIMQKIGIKNFNNRSTWKILIAEILWGKQYVKNVNLDIQSVKYHEETIRDLFLEVINIINNPIDHDKCKFPTYVRVNTLSISVKDALNAFYKEGWNYSPRSQTYENYIEALANLGSKDFIQDFHISELLAFPPGTSFHDHPGYLNGKFLIQDKASCLSSFLLNPKPNSIVLDLAAAPGLKTNHLANMMNNRGILYANDAHPIRNESLKKLLNITSVSCVKISQEHYMRLPYFKDEIEYILIDPPGSYSGIFLLADESSLKDLLDYNYHRFSTLLKHTLLKYSKAKRVVYTICSIYPEEGEKVIDNVLESIGESYTLVDAKKMLWNEWKTVSSPEYKCGNKCLRVCPELDQCQGWFTAVFNRNFDVPLPPFKLKSEEVAKIINPENLENNFLESNIKKLPGPSLVKTDLKKPEVQEITLVNELQKNPFYQNKINPSVINGGNLTTLTKKKRSRNRSQVIKKKQKVEDRPITDIITIS